MSVKTILTLMTALSVMLGTAAGAVSLQKKLLPAIEASEDGMYHQPWFHESFLDLKEDLLETKKAGKRLAIMFEQRGCPYCRETHQVNLRRPEIVNYLKKNFNIIQMDIWGSREVTDFDGEKMPEKKFARKYGVQFTPTIIFLPDNLEKTKAKHPRDREAFRLFGYWKPFHFLNSFVYIKSNGYKKQPNFQRWLSEHADELRKRGKEVKIWE
jgi:thioredoxin-related protein